jgi:phosphohistidine phosphatase SixA
MNIADIAAEAMKPRVRSAVMKSRIVCRLGWFSVLAISLLVVPVVAAADDVQDAWAALAKGGHVVLIRHGNAPPGYGGDPPGFKLDDCSTQRNLDDVGREQARALGEAFRKHGVRVARTLSSPWCRCLETARLMALGEVERSWALVPDTNPAAPTRLDELKKLVGAWRGPGTLVLVTHALTVQPLTGFLPTQAESVVLKPTSESGFGVVGRIPTSVSPPPPPRR